MGSVLFKYLLGTGFIQYYNETNCKDNKNNCYKSNNKNTPTYTKCVLACQIFCVYAINGLRQNIGEGYVLYSPLLLSQRPIYRVWFAN